MIFTVYPGGKVRMKWWYAVILRQNHVKSRRLHERTREMTSGMKRRDHVISIYNFGSRKRYVCLYFRFPFTCIYIPVFISRSCLCSRLHSQCNIMYLRSRVCARFKGPAMLIKCTWPGRSSHIYTCISSGGEKVWLCTK